MPRKGTSPSGIDGQGGHRARKLALVSFLGPARWSGCFLYAHVSTPSATSTSPFWALAQLRSSASGSSLVKAIRHM